MPVPASAATAAAAALSIFKLSPPEPEPAALARRCERILAALLPEFPEIGEAVGAPPPATPAGPPAVEGHDDPFAGDDPFAIAGAPPALEALPAPDGVSVTVAWEDDPARDEIARLEDGTLLVNRLHPAYLRARDAGALDGHLGLSLAWALSGYAAPEAARHFIGRFLLRWADDS